MALEVKDLEPVEASIKSYKEASENAIKLLQADIADFKTKGAAKADIDALKLELKAMDDAYRTLEKEAKAKTITPESAKSFGEELGKAIEENWKHIEEFKGSRKGYTYKMQVKAAADMGITTNVTNPGAYFTTVQPGIRTLPNRKIHMRQLLPLGTMTGSSLTYMREVGGEGTLAPVLENGTKAQFDLDFIEITVPAEYIAGFLRVSRKMLDDMAAFRSYLQMRLMEMYLKVEDQQVLTGTGVSPQISGIMPIATAANVTTGPNIERLIYAISQLEESDYSATGIIVNVAAYYWIALNKAEGSGEYDQPGIVVIQNGQLYVAGVPVYKTTAMATDEYLVGDFEMGAQLFIREQPVIEFFDQDANNVTTNKITVRIEGRIALAIYRAAAFVKGTFDAPTT